MGIFLDHKLFYTNRNSINYILILKKPSLNKLAALQISFNKVSY